MTELIFSVLNFRLYISELGAPLFEKLIQRALSVLIRHPFVLL